MKMLFIFLFISSVAYSQQYTISEAYYIKTGENIEFPFTTVEFKFEKLYLNGEEYVFSEKQILDNGDLVLNYSDKYSKVAIYVRGNEILDVIEYPMIGEVIVYELPKENKMLPSESIIALDLRLKKWK
jgi:hypothetical protein